MLIIKQWAIWPLFLAAFLSAAPVLAGSALRLPKSYNTSVLGENGLTLGDWNQNTAIDLVAAQKGEVLIVPEGFFNQGGFTIGNATTSPEYFRVVMCAPGKERLCGFVWTGNTGPGGLLGVGESYSGIYGLVGEKPTAVSGPGGGVPIFYVDSHYTGTGAWIANCEARNSYADGGYSIGFVGNPNAFIVNCLAWNLTSNVAAIGFVGLGEGSTFFCDLGYGLTYNFYALAPSVAKNCIGANGIAGNWAGSWTLSNCPANGRYNFMNVSTGDFHLTGVADDALNAGVDLSADVAFAFNDDADRSMRPSGAAWDIGPFEYALTAPEPTPARRLGPWGSGVWNSGPWTGGGKVGHWN